MGAQRYEIRPLVGWTGKTTRERRPASTFRAAWSDTLDLLGRETLLLGARLVVIQVDVTAGEIRLDGMLRANARVGSPAVKVAFESKHGPLTYATDEYGHWQANVRAIALSLQALRAVDRYGVSKSGEQYRGWTAIGAKAAEDEMTLDEAARVLADAAGMDVGVLTRERDPDERRKVITIAYRVATKTAHPDAGGNGDIFRLISNARDVLLGGAQ
jgi:hypothetical protein